MYVLESGVSADIKEIVPLLSGARAAGQSEGCEDNKDEAKPTAHVFHDRT
jgi:hypothetical protein